MISYSLSLPPSAPSDGDLHAILIALQDWRASPATFKTDAVGNRVVIPHTRRGGVWGLRVYGDVMGLVWGRYRIDLSDLAIDITTCTTEAEILTAYRGELARVGARVREAAQTMLDAVAAAERQPG